MRWRDAALALCLLLAPAGIVSALLAAKFNATLGDCGPLGDDDVHYWDEIASYSRVGFGGGYFVANEQPAPARWTHFGPHGPAFPVFYGTLARIFGWRETSGPLFNLLVLAAGSAAWVLLVRPNTPRLATALLLTATFWPCLLFVPATMQESLNCAFAFVLAGLAHRVVNGRDTRLRSFWPFFVAAAVAATFRITWVVVLLPFAAVVVPAASRRTRVVVLAAVALAVPSLCWLSREVCAGYPNFFSTALAFGRRDAVAGFRIVLSHARLSLDELFSREDHPLEVLQRYEVVGMIAMTAVLLLGAGRIGPRLRRLAWTAFAVAALTFAAQDLIGGVALTAAAAWCDWRKNGRPQSTVLSAAGVYALYALRTDPFAPGLFGPYLFDGLKVAVVAGLVWVHRRRVDDVARNAVACTPGDEARPLLFAAMNLALVVGVILFAYDVQYFRDYRVVAPHLLLSALVLASGPAYRWALTLAAVNLLFLSAFLKEFDIHRPRVHKGRIAAAAVDLQPYLSYDPAAESPWQNTLLVPDVRLANRVRVPPGIGVSWGVPFAGGGKAPLPPDSPYYVEVLRSADEWMSRPTRSLYLLATPDQARRWRWKGCRLRLLHELPGGTLYLNEDYPPATAD
jgi:hypothetical protein